MSNDITMDRLSQAFLAIKDHRTVKRHAWEAEDLELEQQQDTLKVAMLEMLNKVGGKSIATEHGTVMRQEKLQPSAADWSAVYDWITQTPERFELLEKRLKVTFVKQFMEDNDGALPPGVSVHREYEVAVRRANSKPRPTTTTNER